MKLSKTKRTVIFAIAVPIILAAVVVILLIFFPNITSNGTNSTSLNLDLSEEQTVPINNFNADMVSFFSVQNENSSFSFTRQKRTIQVTDDSGGETKADEYYWTSEDLMDIPQDDSLVRAFITGLAQLSAVSVVEENSEDLDKYGLESPISTAVADFDDGSRLTMLFGIKNPANEQTVYFRMSDSNKVYLINYYSAANVFGDVRKFANLTLTEAYNSNVKNEFDYLRISRADMDLPVEIRYMSELDMIDEDEDFQITTLNTHRFVEPITVEVDSAGRTSESSGKSLCYNIYGLSMSACEYLEKTSENLRECGLDNPFAVVEFKYSGHEYRLSFSETNENKEYYVMLDDTPGIYSISSDSAPWCTFKLSDLISSHPISPYIYSVDSVEISTAEAVYKFEIDSESKTFSCNGEQVDSESFRKFYRQLIGEVGEEVYLTQIDEDQIPQVSVTFSYKEEYAEIYNSTSDTLDFFPSDGRKCVINLNGTTLYKIRDSYVSALLENVDALIDGAEVNTDW